MSTEPQRDADGKGPAKYNEAIGSLDGRLLPAVRRLREMGIGAKEIPSAKPVELQAGAPPCQLRKKTQSTESLPLQLAAALQLLSFQ